KIDSTMQFIRAKLNKDGSFSRTTNVKTAEELEHLMSYVRSIFGQIGAKMLGGEISARPFKKDDKSNGCMFCEFKAMCGFEPNSKNWLFVPNWDDADALRMIEHKVAPPAPAADEKIIEPAPAADAGDKFFTPNPTRQSGAEKLADLQRAARLTKGTDDIIGSIEEAINNDRK
ncbi:MAG: PD-(D/E)XK nuclease family protein, partial [Selenomonadaceae bacterium]|nr:PD-(D/E)XK nuclease family protein [Selenomonadaceae bacterium]